ncbi:hypothetical protein NX059_012545 [Plenodomus lindquistii]|nr:hypothetical protein NX059_012545 [Plenodomus lindquistii]KAI8930551.1 hypothetical protein NX059_012545 [Plenodomus lindquistii]
MTLHDVAICPDFLCNLVSFRLLRQQGIWWDTKADPTTLRKSDNTIIGSLQELHGQWVIEHHTPAPAAYHTHKATSRTLRRAQIAPALVWHKRLGHPGPAAVEHLVQQAEGVRIKGITTVECDSCGRAKARRQIRRAPRNTDDEGPGERLAIDFHSYEHQSITKERSQMLITDRYSAMQWDYYFTDNRTAKSIIKLLSNFILFLKNHFNITVKIIEADNEITTVKPEVQRYLSSQGIIIEPSAPDTQAQNGGAERSGGVNKEKARAMRLDANLSWELWPEITRAAVYLYNRSPNYANNWKTPYEIFFTRVAFSNGIVTSIRKPNLAHLRAYGCKAFAMTDDTYRGKARLQRLDPKAWVGYLVGYRSSNIYRIWIPSLAKVISTRDVTFDEQTTFDGKVEDLMDNLMHSTLEEIATLVRTMELPSPAHEPETESFHEDDALEDASEQNPEADPPGYYNGRKIRDHYPSPPPTPPPAALLAQFMAGTHPEEQSVSSRTIPWAAAFIAGTQAGIVGTTGGEAIDKARLRRMLATGLRPHRSQLPPPPTYKSKLEDHPLGAEFKQAELDHLSSHAQMDSWTEVPIKTARLTGQQILDCMWVYTYKLDKDHNLLKCKARLVVRGDQQRNITSQDTYAATLASRSFRMLMAIAAQHGLELKQFDITNAFVHAAMDRVVYMRMPKGHQKAGTILRVNKALYGLRISPLLWQKEFTATLQKLGFEAIPHEPCCLIKGSIIIFFYVDDIIMAYPTGQDQQATEVTEQLKKQYTITGGHDLQWFLGMEIIRDRASRRIQLSQASYCDKISRLIDNRGIAHDTPMAAIELLPSDGLASHADVNKYQQKIGSLLFAAVTTRPDISFATSRLARHLTNPSHEHHKAADRVLMYLQDTKSTVLQLGGGSRLQVASDASFADNTRDRKSSQGYAIKLYNGLIAWKANKQDTVTTSTTEAELLALSQVAKEALFISRLLQELHVKIEPGPIIIECDNQQTIRLLTAEVSKLQTKLRHVDIHNHWLRQEVQQQRINVQYVQSSEMIADGLTKALPKGSWGRFLHQLGLIKAETLSTPTNKTPIEEIQQQLDHLSITPQEKGFSQQ